ncbi:DNA-directed RNA polymerase [Entomortierella chlamydospora]|nr:DNA-directed RNA polymerase [Entomortierella chlamydospora]
MLSAALTLRGNRTTLACTRLGSFRSLPVLRYPSRQRCRHQSHSTAAIEENTHTLPHAHSIPVNTVRAEADQALHSYTPLSGKLEPIRIVRLPDVKPSEPRESGKFADHQLAEQMAVMYACLNTGDMERARRIFITLHKNNPDDMLILGNIKMHNSFIESYMNASPSPRTKDALKWFESLSKYKVKPDLTSFAILIKGFIKMDSLHTAKVMMMEMQKAGFTIDNLRECPDLQAEDVDRVNQVAGMLKPASARLKPVVPEEPVSVAPASEYVEVNPVKNSKNETVIGVRLMRNTLDALALKDLSRFERQLKLEERSYQAAIDRMEYERENIPDQLNVRPLRAYLWQWHQSLKAGIKAELKRVDAVLEQRSLSEDAALDKDRMLYGPFLKLLSPDKLSMITILEMLRLNNSGGIVEGMKSARALIGIGKAVESEYNAEQLTKKSNKALFDHKFNVHQLYGSGKLFNMAIRKAETKRSEAMYPTDWTPVWPESTRAKLGSVLTTLLMDCAKVQIPSFDPETNQKIVEEIPAFYHVYQYNKGQRVGVIKVHNHISEILSKEPIGNLIHPSLLPMLVHPRPWLSYNDGGYLSAQSTIMRIRHCPQQYDYLRKAHEEGLLFRVYNGLDVLGKTRWAVNKKVLKSVLEAWNSGKEFGKIPAAAGQVEELPKPDDYDTNSKAKAKWLAENRKLKLDAKNHHSLRCDVNYKVEIARAFADEPMYFPHNLDFRGRAYPIPPLFNHLGNDLCRGLLMFDEAKPLGPKGFTWLKIHLANLAGFDKHSLSARAQFTMDHLDDIFDSADNPMDGRRWWLKAEDPWQCLATCIEVSEAIRSGDPESYMSRIPVHQDGTCNGLQHYAALGGDIAGAQQVNLLPSDAPQDVYSGVAQSVERILKKQAAEGVESAQILLGKVTRKIVKQTVMTNVYGVTFVGARAQIENRLKETEGIPEDQVRALSTYLTQQVFASIGEMFTGARAIQDWLAESARRIAKSVPRSVVNPETEEIIETQSKGRKKKTSRQAIADLQMSSVIWTTPLNLPIVQPYRKMEHKQNEFMERYKDYLFPVTLVIANPGEPVGEGMIAWDDERIRRKNARIEGDKDEFLPDMETPEEDPMNSSSSSSKAKDNNMFHFGDDEDDEHDLSSVIIEEDEAELEAEAKAMGKAMRKKGGKKKASNKLFHSWEPISFPPLPDRGDFDIRRVAESDYFFS